MNSTYTKTQSKSFVPHPLIRHHLLQTVLSTKKPARVNWLTKEEQPFLIDAGEDKTGFDESVRLLAYFSPAKNVDPAVGSRGLVLMLHGWGGCSHSTYNLVVTETLLNAGYDVVRLNLRDHGPNLHYSPVKLNVGLFRGTLIEEAEIATHRIAELSQGRPFFIIGPSMGGNFALRLAIRHTQRPVPNLRHVIAVSPAINPASATDALDANLMYRNYFRKMWLRSVQEKIDAFPEHFAQLRAIDAYNTVREMTDWVLPQLTEYRNADEYFHEYGVQPQDIHQLRMDTTIITAQDDPVIPVQDFLDFPDNPALDLRVLDFGGHVGFIDFGRSSLMLPIKHRLPEMILSILGESLNKDTSLHQQRVS